jgi:hypothetical protein
MPIFDERQTDCRVEQEAAQQKQRTTVLMDGGRPPVTGFRYGIMPIER